MKMKTRSGREYIGETSFKKKRKKLLKSKSRLKKKRT